jgi:hypothetical protein
VLPSWGWCNTRSVRPGRTDWHTLWQVPKPLKRLYWKVAY